MVFLCLCHLLWWACFASILHESYGCAWGPRRLSYDGLMWFNLVSVEFSWLLAPWKNQDSTCRVQAANVDWGTYCMLGSAEG